MSKLIRINTEDTNARFNETLSEDFIIEENSSIALQSATFTRDTNVFETHPNNNKITFISDINDLTNTTADDVTIRNFTGRGTGIIYDGINFPDLLANIQASMNNKLRALNSRPNDAGVEVRVHTNNANKVVFEVRKANVLKWTTANVNIAHTLEFLPLDDANPPVPNVSVADRGDGGLLSLAKVATDDEAKRDGLFNIDRAVCISKIKTGHGSKYLSVKVEHLVTNEPSQAEFTTPPNQANPLGIVAGGFDDDGQGQSGFVLGLVDNDGYEKVVQNERFDYRDFYAFCGINNNAGRYFFGHGSRTTFTEEEINAGLTNFKYSFFANSTYVANDRLGIAISGGKIRFFHQRADGSATENLNGNNNRQTRTIDYNRNYYWVIGFIGTSAKTRLTEVEASNDPFTKLPEGLVTTDFGSHRVTALGAHPPAPTSAPITPIVRFDYRLPDGTTRSNTELQNFLGFFGVQLPSPFSPFHNFDRLVCNQAYRFIAPSAVHSSLGFESYNIILTNIPLEGYDTNIDGRKSILYTIVDKRDPTNPVGQTHIAFNSQYPIYMKIDNKNPLSMRQIQARIVNDRYEDIETLGISSLTMLVKRDN